MKYTINNPDLERSPYTGMAKQHWLDVCHLLLGGVFSHIKEFNNPVIVPRHDTQISYPQVGDPKWRFRVERFEGLARTFLVAAPLIQNEPEAKANGYILKDYYANQILLGLDSNSKSYWGRIKDIIQEADGQKAFQHTCECASLVVGLMATKDLIWDRYTQEQRDLLADYLSEFGHYRTNHHNWRFFNMLILAFLKINGYPIDEGTMKDHVTSTLTYYVEDGWYRDGHLFDYYSPWAFQFYGPLWNVWYGYEYEPELAMKIEEYSNKLMENYTQFFDKDGHMMMWGRSNIYRNAAAAPLVANLLLKKSTVNPGLARRILSGNLLQFVTKETFYVNDVPCLGFYGPFEPLLQSYSCATSPFWFANAFICLSFADEAALWTKKENNGIWETLKNSSQTITLDGPALSITNHGQTGGTEMRTAKVLMKKDHPWLADYSRLAFHSTFPWEAIDNKGPEAMQYSLKYGETMQKFSVPNLIMYGGEKEGVLYRRAYFDFVDTFQDNPSIDLADIPVAHGIIRIDRVRIAEKPYELLLGHYGLPHAYEKIEVEKRIENAIEATIAKTDGLQLAFVPYKGWDAVSVQQNNGKNAVSKESTLIYATSKRTKMYAYKEYILITALLHKTDNNDWQEEELYPIHTIQFEDKEAFGSYGNIKLALKDGREITVDFNGLEGRLSI